MKRYGDNLPSKDEDEFENEHDNVTRVIRGGCGVRYEMLNFIKPADIPKKQKAPITLSLFKFGRKKTTEND